MKVPQNRAATSSVQLPPRQTQSAWPNQSFSALCHSLFGRGHPATALQQDQPLTMTYIVLTGLYWSYCPIILPTNDLTPIELRLETTVCGLIPPDHLKVSKLCMTGRWTSPHPRRTPQKFDRLQHNRWSHGMGGGQSPMWQTASVWYISWSTYSCKRRDRGS